MRVMSTNLSIIERGALSTVGLACPGCPVYKDFTAGSRLHDSDLERKPFALLYTWAAMSAAGMCTLADSHVTHSESSCDDVNATSRRRSHNDCHETRRKLCRLLQGQVRRGRGRSRRTAPRRNSFLTSHTHFSLVFIAVTLLYFLRHQACHA